MKKIAYKLLTVVLCLSLCMNIGIAAFAANESNDKGIVFTVSLDKGTLEKSDADQTITMIMKMSEATNIVDMEYDLICDSSFLVADPSAPEGTVAWNGATKHMGWMNTTDVNTDTLGSTVITIPANTPAGTYDIGIKNILLSANGDLDYWEDGASASTTLTITDSSSGGDLPTDGEYNAGIIATPSEVKVGENVSVNVEVTSNGTKTEFSAAEVEVTYDKALLTFKGTTSATAQTTETATGVKIVDHGAAKVLGEGVYTLNFTAKAAGPANITLISAAFDTRIGAEVENLIQANCNKTPVAITIKPADHTVTLPDDGVLDDNNTSVADGKDYIFTVPYYNGYDYKITAKMDGNPVEVIDNKDGTYTIKNVTGDLEITYTRTPKTFNVIINGETESNDGATATFNTDYKFTLKADVAPGTEKGYTYALESVTIGDVAYTGYSVDGKTYTIPGTAITGGIVITITKTEVSETQFTVSVTGDGAGDVFGKYPAVVNKGASHTLTLTPQPGYTYTVTVDGGYSITQNGNAYTISDIQRNVTFTINKSVDTTKVEVEEYLKLNGTSIWLVKLENVKLTGSVYTYQGENMYWSDQYNAYCTLVVDTEKPVPAPADFAVVNGDAVTVDYSMDVNKTGKVDANDAQLVYNMYNAEYSDFTTNVTKEKFLRADVNGDATVNVNDATAIVTFLLG